MEKKNGKERRMEEEAQLGEKAKERRTFGGGWGRRDLLLYSTNGCKSS
jgi:hypothetical protein